MTAVVTASLAFTRLIGSYIWDHVQSAIADGNGGIFVTGFTSGDLDGQSSNGYGDGFIAHYDSTGNKSWTRLIGSSTWDNINTAIADGNGGIFVAGSTGSDLDGQSSNGYGDGFIAHYDSTGNKSWTRLIGSSSWDNINTAIADGNGGIFVAGSTGGDLDGQTNNGEQDGFIAHYDSTGNKSWTRLIGSSTWDNIYTAIADGNGGIFVTGSTSGDLDGQSSNGYGDGFIAHYDSTGNKSWTRLIGSSSSDNINTAIADGNGGIFVAGSTGGDLDGQTNNGGQDGFVVKLNMDNTDVSDDISPPTLQSTAATSNQLILKFSEDIQIAGGGSLNPAYMTVIVDGQTRKVTRSQITGPDHPTIHTASQLVLTLSGRALDSAKSISVSYNPPSNTTSSGFITDLSDNPLASIATQIVDTFSTSTSIIKSGIASAYKNLILTGSTPITGYGNAQNNTITGNDANNTLDGLAGADTMIGGLGDDTYVVDNVGDVITELASAGTDTVQSTIAYTLTNNLENLTLLGSGAINATGNTANNILTGNASANVLNGNGGTDTLIGGRGDDIYIVDSADDIIKETLISSDVDSVESSVSWVLGTNLENLTLTGTTTINGTGNELDNTIIGNSANNILDGGNGGTDLLTGLGGADTFKFSSRPSSFRNSSADHITDFSSVQGDKIMITKSAFGINASTATLSVVSNATALNTALSTASLFVYNTSNGELHWNQNGIIKGAGTGGVLAILDNKATLSAGDLVLV
ncbi:hypothetical protein KBY83_09210 [Cyanobium sp. WKJ7-Wakatipu]|uniref:beta strand repeat-containing protein n=1 Tax=Cyanobium sp. WKJ7-Wakatipu TaxID=2823726 RepID=UPI0020CC89D7|nr:SwmB domain-containing protein [Cyanobium sp. WKJ7-Wakatipu]MCP9783493.1 hypothetical protein [Cyanobium sp. WKJ7-Wakatipu]